MTLSADPPYPLPRFDEATIPANWNRFEHVGRISESVIRHAEARYDANWNRFECTLVQRC